MKLYLNKLSPNCRRVSATVAYNGRDDIEIVNVDFQKGEHKRPAFLAINPNGKVPALTDGDLNLWESNAIMQYISSDSSLWPPSKVRYDIARWQFWGLAHLGQATGKITFQRVLKPSFGLGDPDEAVVEAALEEFNRYATVLNGQLEGQDYLVGDSVTLADFSVAASLTYAGPSGLDLSPYPNITAWLARLDEIEAWKDSGPSF